MTEYSSLFLSHGAPTLLVEDSPARRYLSGLGNQIGARKAILVISAHHHSREDSVAVTSGLAPETIYDFSGFPEALYQVTYPASGDPELAAQVISCLNAAGFTAVADVKRGFDHGAWVPLHLMYPDADIPVIQISINMQKSPQWHFDLGRALAPFRREGILIVGSGGATHNLRAFFKGEYELDAKSPEWVTTFADWLSERIEAGDVSAVLDAVESGPEGHRNHPSMDHILPLFVAMGAGGERAKGRRLHKSSTYGVLAMDTYAFSEN
ncbi:MAG: class III extradiol ring-cleavage dioxygenase [Pseudomonadota bacterium]